MSHTFTSKKRIRKNFGKHESATPLPDLIEIQKNSYDQFLQTDIEADKRENKFLHGVFSSAFPVEDPSEQQLWNL